MGLLEFRGVGISGEDDDICIDLISGFWIPAEVRGKDWVVPRLDGQIEGNRRKDKLILPLAGFIRGSGSTSAARREDFLTNVTTAMAVLDPSLASGTLTLSQGYLGLGTGAEATIQARVRDAAPGKMQSGQAFQLWTFELEALTPEWTLGS